ncbi:MAG: hypothetical protein EAX81_06080 [Candidatus Thorarchaeota archaeon]|nr:hypothetical protein [Candidatus Thorarchaeota archaeon]
MKSIEVEIITLNSSKAEQEHPESNKSVSSKANVIDPPPSKKKEEQKSERGIDDSELEYNRRWYIV